MNDLMTNILKNINNIALSIITINERSKNLAEMVAKMATGLRELDNRVSELERAAELMKKHELGTKTKKRLTKWLDEGA